MDKSLGDIMKWLEENGLEKNTAIIFMSDNGGYSTSTRWRDAPLHTQNAPLNSGKGSAYEGGMRVPMIVKWPGITTPGSRCDEYVIIEDFFPTILDIAQVEERKTKQPIDGISFIPKLKGEETNYKERALVWHYPNRWGNEGPGIGTTSTIRKGDWKLIYYYETGMKELFNINDDIGETLNRAKDEPQRVQQLASELGAYLRSVNALRPSFKSSGDLSQVTKRDTKHPSGDEKDHADGVNDICPWPDE